MRLRRFRTAGRPSRGGHHALLQPLRVDDVAGGVEVEAHAALLSDGELCLTTTCLVRPDGAVEVSARLVSGERRAAEGAEAVAGAGGTGGAAGAGGVGFCAEGALCLRSLAHGAHLEVEGEAVRARWDDEGAWQQLVLRFADGGGEAGVGGEEDGGGSARRQLCYGDVVSLTAHTNHYLGVRGGEVVASGRRQGEFGPLAPSAAESWSVEPADGRGQPGERVVSGGRVALRCVDGGGFLGGRRGEAADSPLACAESAAVWEIRAGERAAPLRVGFVAALTRAAASRVRWHGLGPHESYPDRMAGARVGVWDGSVAAQTHRYCRPQENGNKMGTRWMALSDAAGSAGLLVVSRRGAPLPMQCHHFALDDFDVRPGSAVPEVRHGGSLQEAPWTTLCIDGAHAGVGGIDSWGSQPLPQHRLSLEQPVEWAFALRPFSPEEEVALPDLVRALA